MKPTCKCKDRTFTLINTPKIIIIPDIEIFSPQLVYGMKYNLWVMPAPLCSPGKTRFDPVRNAITDPLCRCDSTTCGGNSSAYGHHRLWHLALGTSRITSHFSLQRLSFFRLNSMTHS